MKDYRVTVKVRNNRILAAIKGVGGEPGVKWCDANGLGYVSVNDLINMTASPLTADGEMRALALKLCDVLNKLPDELWSNEQLRPLEKNFSEMEMDHEQVLSLLPAGEQSYLPDFSGLENSQIKNVLVAAMDGLTEREREVLRLRFEDDLTLEEIAKRFDVHKERIRQIEAKALRKMRHPEQVVKYLDCMDIPGVERFKKSHNPKLTGSLQ